MTPCTTTRRQGGHLGGLDELDLGEEEDENKNKTQVISNQNHREWMYGSDCQVTTVLTSGNYPRDGVLNKERFKRSVIFKETVAKLIKTGNMNREH